MKLQKRTKTERNIILNNLNGIFQVICVNLVSSYAGIFVKRLAPNDDNLISLLNSLPAFFSVAAILLGTGLAASIKNKKKAASAGFFLTRLFYLLMAGIVFVSPEYRALVFVVLYSALNFPGSIATFLWQSFFADIFAPSVRAKMLSMRNFFSTFIGTLTTLVAGFSLTFLSNKGGNFIVYYQIIFVIAFLIGCIETLTLYMHSSNTNSSFAEITSEKNSFSFSFFKEMFKHKNYMYFIICTIVFNFAWQMGWPVFLTYEYNYLHSNEMWSGLNTTINGICTAIGYVYWRRLSEKIGTAKTLAFGTAGVALAPVFYVISTSIVHISIFSSIIGFFSASTLLVLISTLYEVAPVENRTAYIAFYNLVTNLTLIAAPWVGMEIYKVTDIWTTFIIVAAFRFFASLLFFIRQKKLKCA